MNIEYDDERCSENQLDTFCMYRLFDESGVSGTGKILLGVRFPSGKVVVEWITKNQPDSLGIYNTFEDFEGIHINSHPSNKTIIKWTT